MYHPATEAKKQRKLKKKLMHGAEESAEEQKRIKKQNKLSFRIIVWLCNA